MDSILGKLSVDPCLIGILFSALSLECLECKDCGKDKGKAVNCSSLLYDRCYQSTDGEPGKETIKRGCNNKVSIYSWFSCDVM